MSHKTLSKRRASLKGSVWLPLLIAALGLGVVGFAATGVMRRSRAPENVAASRKEYVNRRLLTPRLAAHLNALGDRLEKSGKERLTVTGVLHVSADSQARPIAVTLEFPDRFRIVIQNGPLSRVITSDRVEQRAADEPELIETLAYDSAEHFFSAQMQGNATRFLGARFRTWRRYNHFFQRPTDCESISIMDLSRINCHTGSNRRLWDPSYEEELCG